MGRLNDKKGYHLLGLFIIITLIYGYSKVGGNTTCISSSELNELPRPLNLEKYTGDCSCPKSIDSYGVEKSLAFEVGVPERYGEKNIYICNKYTTKAVFVPYHTNGQEIIINNVRIDVSEFSTYGKPWGSEKDEVVEDLVYSMIVTKYENSLNENGNVAVNDVILLSGSYYGNNKEEGGRNLVYLVLEGYYDEVANSPHTRLFSDTISFSFEPPYY